MPPSRSTKSVSFAGLFRPVRDELTAAAQEKTAVVQEVAPKANAKTRELQRTIIEMRDEMMAQRVDFERQQQAAASSQRDEIHPLREPIVALRAQLEKK